MQPRQMRETCIPVEPNRTYSILLLLSALILFVADLFQPVGRLAVELFHNGDVGHGRGWCSPVPMLFTRWEPDHVTRPNFLNRASPALGQAKTGRYDQGLAQRVGVPGCPSARLEGDSGPK